ncbi:MAG: efflux RND transporter periplasmic adaptor subunit [Holophagales bacterium]|nr:efflux RND transporter periplasmic adaptor subunit [Holophagales bacterium]
MTKSASGERRPATATPRLFTRPAFLRLAATPLAVGLLALAGCGGEPAPQGDGPPPRAVTVAKPRPAQISDIEEFPARLEAFDRVEIRARVAGRLESLSFEPRSIVRAGQLLFHIEPDRYAAAVARAKADLERARARAVEAQATLERFEQALERNAISELEVLQQRAARDTTAAEVVAAEAALETAELDLAYSSVRSPITGRISRDLVDVGNLVGADGPTLLATVVRTDQIHAYFQVDEQTSLAFRRRNLERLASAGGAIAVPVELRLMDEEDFEHLGVVDYASPELDPASGTVEVRALFDNSDGLLSPGYYARVRLATEGPHEGLLVPTRALGRDVGGAYVLVVDADDVVTSRPVELGVTQGPEREVVRGLDGSERVIVEGTNVVRPGDRVTPRWADENPGEPTDDTATRG